MDSLERLLRAAPLPRTLTSVNGAVAKGQQRALVHASLAAATVGRKGRHLTGTFCLTGDTMEGIIQCLVFLKAFSKNCQNVEKRLSTATPLPSAPPRVTARPSTQTEIIEFAGMRFLITDTPNEVTIRRFVQNLQRCNVSLLVGICGVQYDTEPFKAANIIVKSLNFVEGTDPDERLKKQWFRILHENMTEYPDTCVAVHCNSGLGRAAVLVAIALIELGMSYDVAVAVIRSKRRGAINNAQYEYLRQYQPELNLVQRKAGSSSSCVLQ